MTTSCDAARVALAEGDFEAAVTALAGDAADLDDAALTLRADAHYGAGRFEASVHDREALYVRQVDEGREDDAAATAAAIALQLMVDTALLSAVRGWVRRSQTLLGDSDDPEPGGDAVRAVIAAVCTYERLLSGDAAGAADHAAVAIELGDRHGVHIARFLGRIASARLAAVDGRLDEGVAVLDEVALELMSGHYEPFLIGNLYCELVCAAQALMLVDRAREWTDVVDQWRPGVASGGMHGRCRVHRAELMRVSGPADAAEREAMAACSELRPWMRREFGWPLAELGNARLRRGDLAGAEEAFLRAHEHAWPALPGLALLRMEQGDPAAAAELVAGEIAHPSVLPWKERPPIADLQLIPLLEAQAEIAVPTDDAAVAAEAAAGLHDLAEGFPTPGIRAGADLAAARAALLRGDADAAASAASAAVATWIDLDAPYDAAMARVVLGRAHTASGNRAQARIDWACARDAFETYGAPRRVAEMTRMLHGAPPERPVASAYLHRRPHGWRIGFAGREADLADLKGVQMLARLLAAPGESLHVLDLAEAQLVSAGMPVLDDEAKAVYRRRLAEVEADIAEAQRDHDLARVELAGRDRDYLLQELSRAVGLGGRDRTTGGTVERSRTSVTRTLRYAIARITDELPDLGAHLTASVHTGTECRYAPDPVSRVRWELGHDDR